MPADGTRPLFKSPVQSGLFRHASSLILLLVLVVEGVVVLVVIRDLHNSYLEVEGIYDRSVRGLRRIGECQYEAQETRRSTLYALTTSNGNLQVDYADQSREADRRVTEGIAEFLAQARTPQERMVGQRLTDDWSRYLSIRNEVLGLILEGSTKEAVDLDLSLGVPLFDRVRQDLEDVKRLDDEHASQRVAAVAGFSRRSAIKLSAALGFGLLFGSIAIWTIQRGSMRSALQLANLQIDFVASVSHELRTPITAILSAGENFRDGLVHGEESLKRQGSIITGQAVQLMNLVDQVLLYAATTKDKPWHDVRPLLVSDIVDDALRKVSIHLREGGFTVEQEIQSGLPPVAGDLSVLSQCLQNLIANAVKYSGQSRWVGISVQLAAGTAKASEEVQISVCDHGLGINAEDLERVFEPFYRSRRAVLAQIRGTGLGLSIAKRSAEASGGRLTVVSEEGVGSVFTLHLAAAKELALASRVPKIDKGVEA